MGRRRGRGARQEISPREDESVDGTTRGREGQRRGKRGEDRKKGSSLFTDSGKDYDMERGSSSTLVGVGTTANPVRPRVFVPARMSFSGVPRPLVVEWSTAARDESQSIARWICPGRSVHHVPMDGPAVGLAVSKLRSANSKRRQSQICCDVGKARSDFDVFVGDPQESGRSAALTGGFCAGRRRRCRRKGSAIPRNVSSSSLRNSTVSFPDVMR